MSETVKQLTKIALTGAAEIGSLIGESIKMQNSGNELKAYDEENLPLFDKALAKLRNGDEETFDSTIESMKTRIDGMQYVSSSVKKAKKDQLTESSKHNKASIAKDMFGINAEERLQRSEMMIRKDPSTHFDQLINLSDMKNPFIGRYGAAEGTRLFKKQENRLIFTGIRAAVEADQLEGAHNILRAAFQYDQGSASGREQAAVLLDRLEVPVRKLQEKQALATLHTHRINEGLAIDASPEIRIQSADIINDRTDGIKNGNADRKNVIAIKLAFTSGYATELSNNMRNYTDREAMTIAADSVFDIKAGGQKVPDALLVQAFGVKYGMMRNLPLEEIVQRSVDASSLPLPTHDISTSLLPPLAIDEKTIRNAVSKKSNPELHGLLENIPVIGGFFGPKVETLSPYHRKLHTDMFKMCIHAYKMDFAEAASAATDVLSNNISTSGYTPVLGEFTDVPVERSYEYRTVIDPEKRHDIIAVHMVETLNDSGVAGLRNIKATEINNSSFQLRIRGRRIYLQPVNDKPGVYYIGSVGNDGRKLLIGKDKKTVEFNPRIQSRQVLRSAEGFHFEEKKDKFDLIRRG